VRVAGRELLGYTAAHGRAVDVGPVDAEVVEDSDDVLGEKFGAVESVGIVAFTGAAVVEGEGAADGVEVDTDRVPPVVVVGLARQQDQRWSFAWSW
jgi:hypothetical protein